MRRWQLLIQGLASLLLGVVLVVDLQRSFVKLVAYLGVFWLVCGIAQLATAYVNRLAPSAWQRLSAVLAVVLGVGAVALAMQVGSRQRDALIFVAGGFGLAVGASTLASGALGAAPVDWVFGAENILFGLIVIVLYLTAPPLVLVSVVVCAILAGLAQLALGVFHRGL